MLHLPLWSNDAHAGVEITEQASIVLEVAIDSREQVSPGIFVARQCFQEE